VTIPTEVLIWLASGNMAFLTLVVHLLIRIADSASKSDKAQMERYNNLEMKQQAFELRLNFLQPNNKGQNA
jgi:hypothetical protein